MIEKLKAAIRRLEDATAIYSEYECLLPSQLCVATGQALRDCLELLPDPTSCTSEIAEKVVALQGEGIEVRLQNVAFIDYSDSRVLCHLQQRYSLVRNFAHFIANAKQVVAMLEEEKHSPC